MMSDTQYGLQLMVNMVLDYSQMELYDLQPVKSVVLAAQPTPYAASFRRRFFANHQAVNHPQTNIIIS